jgi:TolB protein
MTRRHVEAPRRAGSACRACLVAPLSDPGEREASAPCVLQHRNGHLRITAAAAILLCLITALPSSLNAKEPSWQRLTTDGLLKQRPVWSPDGRRLVFARHAGSTIFLFLRDLETGKEERLTTRTDPEFDAVFSPDGTSLLFSFDKASPNQGDIEVYRLLLADRSLTPVATNKTLSHEEWPSFSPDGKRFAFTSTRDGQQEVYTASVEGGEWTRLTSDPGIDAHPAWSPDGKSIAFSTNRWGDLEIALIQPDGAGLKRLTESRGLDDYPSWSSDSQRLAWTSNRDGNFEIYVQPLGGQPTNITQSPSLENFPAWTPDGRIGFISNRHGGFEIYTTQP